MRPMRLRPRLREYLFHLGASAAIHSASMLRVMRSLVILAGALMPLHARGAEMILSKDDIGQLWLQITGQIDDGDDVKFRNMLIDAISRGEQIANVSVYSPGGRIIPAIRIGGHIRTLHLSTVGPQLVPLLRQRTCSIYTADGRRTTISYDPRTNRGDPRCACAGECFLIWAAGSTRLGDAVQIHRIPLTRHDYAKPSGTQPTEMHASSEKVVEEYLREMGIPEATISRMSGISSDQMEYLTKDERDMLAYNTKPPLLNELLMTRCRQHAATSPAALACEKAVIGELYWKGAMQLLSPND
jgi:hypothetical protein